MTPTPYFIQHPVIAIILNCLIVVLGLLCLDGLSIREYPEISYPAITVSSSYPNASPALVETSVTNMLEEQLAGINGVETMTSQSSVGYSEITLTFHAGTPMDRAMNSTQYAVEMGKSRLPREVKSPTVDRLRKSSGIPFIGIALESTSMGFGELTHFAKLNLKNALQSVRGVASVEVWGEPFTYNIRLDPEKLFSFGVNVDDVTTALANSHVSLPVGLYQQKIPSTLNAQLKTQADYENLLVKPNLKHPVFLKSIGSVALETDKSETRTRINGHTGLVLAINRASDANPLDVSSAVQHVLESIRPSLPPDLTVNVIIDQSKFIDTSIKNIRAAIGEAIVLVLLIIFLFLRNVRATFIPLITIPISLLGSVLFLKLFGFSINLMTLLAMVLAIGLVVDDAIVVLENIWRHIENGLSPINAAILGAREIAFAIIAMTLTLASVYLPIAFISGILGPLFIEFAVALAGSVFISGIVALTLSPLMCAHLLSAQSNHGWPQIDAWLFHITQSYSRALSRVLLHQKWVLASALISIAACIALYSLIEQETAPKEDRGLIVIEAPPIIREDINTLDKKGASLEALLPALPESDSRLTFMGYWGIYIMLPLKPHAQRVRTAHEIKDDLQPIFNHSPSMDPDVWSWDTGLPGIDDTRNHSSMSLVISSTDDFNQLFKQTEKLQRALEHSHQFGAIRSDLHLNTIGYSIDVDHNQLAKLGLKSSQVAKTIEVFFNGDKTQTFEKEGVIYNLTIKGTSSPWTLNGLYLTTATGRQVSLGALTTMKPVAQQAVLDHTQQLRSTTLYVALKKGDSIARASQALWAMAKKELPQHYKPTWTGAVKALNEVSNQMLFLFFLSLVFIYAILSAQFENFVDPFIILLTIPLACTGGLLFAYLFHQTLNIYTEVGLITLVGLISKHGILMVSFANQLHKEGTSFVDAIQKAAVLRLRPILMTTGAMVFGAIPLVISHDAGSEARYAIGMVLIGGLSLGTLFTLFVLPTVYCIVKHHTGTPSSPAFLPMRKE